MFEPEIQSNQRMNDALAFYEHLLHEVHSDAPGSIGQQIRAEAMESDYALEVALRYVVVDQLWGRQVDSDGISAPEYKPSTVRKKAKIGHPADKLVNYTQAWTGRFYESGVMIHADADANLLMFMNTHALPYFQYIPDRYFGLTTENLEKYKADMEWYVGREQVNYINRAIETSEYADILNGLRFLGMI